MFGELLSFLHVTFSSQILANKFQQTASSKDSAICKLDLMDYQKPANLITQIQHVESEQWLGALLDANDRLVTSLMTFEQLDRSIDADSDSDDEMAEQAHLYNSKSSINHI